MNWSEDLSTPGISTHAERLLRARLELAQIAATASLDELMAAAVDMAECLTDSAIGFFHFVDEDQEHLTLTAWSTRTLQSMCTAEGQGQHYPISKAGVWVDCFKVRRPVIHNDYLSLPHRQGLPEGHAPVERELAVPVLRGDKVMAILGVGNKATPYGEEDVRVIDTLASLVIDIVTRLRAEEETRRHMRLLEAIRQAHDNFLAQDDLSQSFGALLLALVELTESEGGYLEEILHSSAGSGDRRRLAAVGEVPHRVPCEPAGGSNQPTIVNPGPDGAGPACLCLPLTLGSPGGGGGMRVMGMAVVLRQRGDYPQRLATFLEPFSGTCASMIHALQQRREQQASVSRKLESLGVLAGGIAHDFNNILQAVLGNAELVLQSLPGDCCFERQCVEEIEGAARRAADLTLQMLAYSGRGRFVVKNLDLNVIVRETLTLLEPTLSKKARVHLNLGSRLPAVRFDPAQARLVVTNLLINAAESLPEGEGEIWLATGVRYCTAQELERSPLPQKLQASDYAYLEVRDNGCGMSGPTLEKLFDPFFTTKFTGRGLGMSAVLGIVRGHHGAILVDSQPGQGTRVEVLIPTVASQSGIPSLSRLPEAGQGGTVLFVDDEPTVRNVGQRLLQLLGYQAVTAADGMAALAQFKEYPGIECVVLDLSMPGWDGEETIRELRAVRPEVRVILASGYPEEDLQERFADQGVAAFIQKPYSLQTLSEALHRARSVVDSRPERN